MMETDELDLEWSFGTRKDGGANAIFDRLNRVVCSFPEPDASDTRRGCPSRSEETMRNARLIATAPALRKTLEKLTEWACTHTSPVEANSPHMLLVEARALLAMSEGEESKTEATPAEYASSVSMGRYSSEFIPGTRAKAASPVAEVETQAEEEEGMSM